LTNFSWIVLVGSAASRSDDPGNICGAVGLSTSSETGFVVCNGADAGRISSATLSGTSLAVANGVDSRVLSYCSTASAGSTKILIEAGMVNSSASSVLVLRDMRSVREDVGEAGSLLAADTSDRVSKPGVKMPSSD